MHRRNAVAGLRLEPLTFRNQFGADDRDLARGLDSQSDLTSLQANYGDADIVADEKLLHQLPREHQHGALFLSGRSGDPRFPSLVPSRELGQGNAVVSLGL
jgi:hypothetical protein